MICRNCGADIGENVNFCPRCGMAAHSRKVCPQCREKKEPDAVYCDVCGTLLKAYSLTGALLLRINTMNLYIGESAVSMALAKGDLMIFDDRIAFIGGQNPSWMETIQKNKPNPLQNPRPLDQIRSVRTGTRFGKPCLILGMADSQVVSLVSNAADASSVTRAMTLIEEYKLARA